MNQSVSAADAERFRAVIARELGLHFDDERLGQLARLLHRRSAATRRSAEGYLSHLEWGGLDAELPHLSAELTVPETYFFRNGDQLRAFAEVALPERMRAGLQDRRLSILSAGCASGEEPYSIAMIVRDLVDAPWNLSILGVDINPAMVAKAREARYAAWALRDTPPAVRQRWFTTRAREFVLDDAIRSAVRFETRNLVADDPLLWQPETYDVVFFRNVLMYFTAEHTQRLVARIVRALKPGGYLFLGHAETLRSVSSAFQLRHTHGTFYYQRHGDSAAADPRSMPAARSHAAPCAAGGGADPPDAWVDVIRQATARVERLTGAAERITPPAGSDAPAPARALAWDLRAAFDLLREERFSEASALVRRLPPEAAADRDVLLLRAALLTHGGELAEAERACGRLLDVDDRSAGAHYLIALCREGTHDRAGAIHHDRVAAYLDPGFAMPRLHLGLLARRAGDRAGAQTELGRALPLLRREHGSRVLLFGGGFTRDTLVALCQAELAACGGAS